MIKRQYFFSCNECGKEHSIPLKDNVQSTALARTVVKMKGWKYKGENIDICPDCIKIEYKNKPSSRKQERNLAITVLYVRGMKMEKLAKQYNMTLQRVSQIINREVNKKKAKLSQIPGFTDSQEHSFLNRCLQFKEKSISILRR